MGDGVRSSRSRDATGVEPEKRALGTGEDQLAEYQRRKLELAELIRTLISVASQRHDEEKGQDARELQARLAEDAFQLAVVGQFSRGKSTLMNAILGRPYLPAGSLPMTSVVTSVRYGSRPRVLVRRAGSSFPIETRLDELARYVAQASREREELRVVSVEVEVPVEILRLGFAFVDTPGIGSAIAANTAATESFLPEADAVIFVTSFDAPLSEAELTFLTEVRTHVEKLFLVVNKRDLVTEEEAASVLRYVREQVDADSVDLRVVGISAREALASRMNGDQADMAKSRLLELERPLIRFLTQEKSQVFLSQVAGRAQRLLIRQRLDLELGRLAQSVSGAELQARRSRLRARVEELVGDERAIADRLRARIEGEFPGVVLEQSSTWPEELRDVLGRGLDQSWSETNGRSARGRLEQATKKLVEAAQDPLENWLRLRTVEARASLIQLAGREISALQQLQGSVEAVGAETFGVSLAENQGQTDWAPTEPPQLALSPIAFGLSLHEPWWLFPVPAARLESRLRRHLLDTAEQGIRIYCAEVREALTAAASWWLESFRLNVEAEMRKRADRLHDRLQHPDSARHLALLDDIEQRLTDFREALATWDPPPAAEEVSQLARPVPPEGSRVGTPGCVICEQIGRVPFDYLAHLQYDLATSESSRVQHAERGGFCTLHTWQYAETASDLGIALAYAELATSAAQLLRAADQPATTVKELDKAVERFIPGSDRCPMCLAVAEAQRSAVAELIAQLQGAPRNTGDVATPSLCVPHLAATIAADPNVDRGRWLIRRHAGDLDRIAQDMRTYALKRESLRRHLLTDEERAAYLQAISLVAGHRALARPWRHNDELHFS